jgi:hypothetical protein
VAPAERGKCLHAGPDGYCAHFAARALEPTLLTVATIIPVAEQTSSQPLEQQLQEIGAQLAWVRDYL